MAIHLNEVPINQILIPAAKVLQLANAYSIISFKLETSLHAAIYHGSQLIHDPWQPGCLTGFEPVHAICVPFPVDPTKFRRSE